MEGIFEQRVAGEAHRHAADQVVVILGPGGIGDDHHGKHGDETG